MKILIIDDHPQRYGKLLTSAESIEVSRQSFDFVSCANDARKRMEVETYDLVVFDILIPLWPDTEADRQNSADLLADIMEGEGLRKARYIVGITADRNVAATAMPEFARYLWTIVGYSEVSDEWIAQLLNCIAYIKGIAASNGTVESAVDLAIICALSEPELSEVLRLPWNFGAARPLDDVTFVHDGTFLSGGSVKSVAAVAASRMGMVAASLVTARVIERLRPKLIIMAGICAGIEGQVNLGDVIFADPCWDWQSGKYIREKEKPPAFAIAPHQLGPSAVARAHIEQIRSDRKALAAISVEGPDEAPAVLKVVIGPVASGSAVIADEGVVTEIRSQNRKVCGIEMEAYGVFAAVESCSGPRPEVLVLKAVCDFADPQKDDKVQRYAAYASARVVHLLVDRFFDRLVS